MYHLYLLHTQYLTQVRLVHRPITPKKWKLADIQYLKTKEVFTQLQNIKMFMNFIMILNILRRTDQTNKTPSEFIYSNEKTCKTIIYELNVHFWPPSSIFHAHQIIHSKLRAVKKPWDSRIIVIFKQINSMKKTYIFTNRRWPWYSTEWKTTWFV